MTIVDESNDRIALLTIYDKQDADTVDLNVIRKMTRELGFILEQSSLTLSLSFYQPHYVQVTG